MLLQFAYFILFEAFFAATLGKMVMGLRVVKADGSPYSWSSVIVRNLLRFIDALPVFYLIGLITVAVSKRNQRLGDMAAGTLVVRAR